MRHPNVVQVFEVGKPSCSPFLSLEFCEGGSLDKLLAGHADRLTSVAMSADGKQIASGRWEAKVRAWSAKASGLH